MRIVLRWLIDHVWLLYVLCAIGALVYLVRALAAQRERSLAMFTLEHETATVRAVRAWAMVFLFVVLSLMVFIGTRLVLASPVLYDPTSPLPTLTPSSGVQPPTAGPTLTPTESITMPTLAPLDATPAPATPVPVPTQPATAAPTASPSPSPTPTTVAQGPLSGSLNVRFGDFGALVGWELSSGEVVVGEPLVLTLYWQGLEGGTSTNYTVFTHLIAGDGSLVAQHDGPPANGANQTSDWTAGETIVDTHRLSFRSTDEVTAGPAQVLVGLYDPEDIDSRLVTSEGQDYVALPVTVNVLAP